MFEKYFYNPPVVIKKLFSDFQWDSVNNKILLTFDDGPIRETTESILKSLKTHNLKALFFCVGNNIKNNPGLCEKILNDGHTIGNHTFNHKKINKISEQEVENEIRTFNELMVKEFNYDTKYFRPPHGKFGIGSSRIIKGNKLKCVMWSLLTCDFNNDFDYFKRVVDNHLTTKSIAVLHDSLRSKDIILRCIDYIVELAEKKNLTMGEPAECLK